MQIKNNCKNMETVASMFFVWVVHWVGQSGQCVCRKRQPAEAGAFWQGTFQRLVPRRDRSPKPPVFKRSDPSLRRSNP